MAKEIKPKPEEWTGSLIGKDTFKCADWFKGTGHKKDEGKVQVGLVPNEAILAIAEILTLNVPKYSARNWELGMDWQRPYDALQRHMLAWWQGDSLDLETGKSHLWHAACNIAFLIAYEQRGVGKDNRPIINKR